MALRRNLSPNPALKNDATGWSGPSGWVRSTSLGALPRTTGFEGTTAGDIATPRALVTAGQQYYWSISIRADEGAIEGEFIVNFYSSPTSGGYISNSGSTVEFSLANGEIARYTVGPYTVPSGGVASSLKINDITGAAEVTAYHVEHVDTAGGYFDGDTLGASWDGSSGNSSSTIREITDTFTVGETYSKTETASGPVGSDAFTLSESFSIAAATTVTDAIAFRDSFLIASLEHDEVLGRNRVEAFTFAASVQRVRVSRRIAASGAAFEPVRGGIVLVLDGYMIRPVDDYEYPAGEPLEYRIEGLANTSGDDVVVQWATVTGTAPANAVWLKFLAAPALNRRLSLLGWSEVERRSRTGIYDVQGRSDPVVVSDVHSSRRLTITCKTDTVAERDTLDAALAEGLACFLHVPRTIALPTLYATVGDYQWRTPGRHSTRAIFEIPLVEVAAPSWTVSAAFNTWQSTLDAHLTWEALTAAIPTWRGVVA